MKEEILKRAMFAMPLSKDARNSGIMSGFDMDEMDEAPEPSEEMPQMARTPQNPEILMNTLRGDMRSVDARYQELAQMVGEEAAMETPPEVLAMLQSQLQQQAGGIAGLPGAQDMAAPQPGAPAQGAPAAGPAPQQAPAGPQGIAAAMPPGMASAPPFSQGAEAPQKLADGGSVSGNGVLNLQVPLNFGGAGGAGMGGGMGGGTSLQQGYGGGGSSPSFGTQPMQQQQFQQGQGMIPGLPAGIDQRAVQANPQAYQQWLQAAQAQERARPGSTMFSQGQGMSVAQGNPMMQGGQRYYADGGSVEPMTPDGMPPMHAQVGAFATPLTRAAQWMGDKVGPYASAANAAAGRMFMSPQFGVERMTGGVPAMPLTVQGAESLMMNPATGQIIQGTGTRLAPYTSLSGLQAPTLTEGIGRGAGQLAAGAQRLAGEYPRLSSALAPVAAAGTWLDTVLSRSPQESPEETARRQALIDQIPTDTRQALIDSGVEANYGPMASAETKRLAGNYPAPKVAMPPPGAAPEEKGDLDAFIADKLAAKEAQWAKEGEAAPAAGAAPLSKAERIKAAREDYAQLYKDILGDTKGDMQTNALLMLADAGFKYAGMTPRAGMTPVSMLAQAASGIPQGFMALAAQAKDRQIKIDTATLAQAVNDIQLQDQQAFQIQRDTLKGYFDVLKKQAEKGGVQVENLGSGIGNYTTKDGGYVGTAVMMVPDGKGGQKLHPAAETILSSPYTLRMTDNPNIENRGISPLPQATTKEEVKAATTRIGETSSALKSLDNIEGIYTRAYGPGAWFLDKVNNLVVPLAPSMATKSGMDLEGAKVEIKAAVNSLSKSIASEGSDGRLSNQVQEWARDVLGDLDNPTKFWASPEFMAKKLSTLRTMLLNARQEQLAVLGLEKNDLVMRAPNTGTANDPFVIPPNSDPEAQKRMYTFLLGTVGRVQDPRASVFIRKPDGTIISVSPSAFRSQMQ